MEKFKFETGDIGFVVGKGVVSKLIGGVTGGPFSHVFLAVNARQILETDGKWLKAKFTDVSEYDESTNIVVCRPKFLNSASKLKIKLLCTKYKGTPYSYWDCFMNFLVSPFNDRIRSSTTAWLGSSKFMKCDELTMTIIYEATGYEPYKHHESFEPVSLAHLTMHELDEDFTIFDRRK